MRRKRCLRRGGNRWPQQLSDQPDDQRHKKPEKNDREQENQKHPTWAAHGRDIATNDGSRVAANPASEHGHIAGDLRRLLDPDIATKSRGVAVYLSLILDHNASSERSHVAGDMPTHTDAAAKASRLADFFIGADEGVVSDVG